MDRKERFSRLIEIYLNESRLETIESFYGLGTRIKITKIDKQVGKNHLFLEASIVLGDVINEDVMDREMADILIQDALIYMFPDYSITVMMNWDV
jgi:hypothetical protein